MKREQFKEYCDAEFENIDAVSIELFSVVKNKKSKYSTAELAAIATFIHNFYNGVENILKRALIIRQVEMIDTPTWHKDLLKTSSDMGIINTDLYNALSNYLSFRHFFIHAYSFTLRWEELKPLVDDLKNVLKSFKSEIYRYVDGFQ
jgi:uncharacterized protein YutE (UPF0331/DUF86 family)